ncbi:MarR family transcriptional regulator [Streptomyces albus subsp. chlorinus]|uniref:MarR family winged helix-turn-helix transcriptional regulator n=1 Tax=Streptomyces albus TaxID=1888 RepID=UPI0015714B02|nr:MarR family transcriptional regulator [Streptomyces albus]NSC20320.1 MarR family transcriptional regulator [Streptomyces albus subsp. chlorinus]
MGTGRNTETDAAFEMVLALHRLLRSLRRAGPTGGLQPTQLIVLSLLVEGGPSRVGVLAERVPCSQPTATAVVAELEALGFVRREPDPTDGRATRVAATEEGRGTLRDVAYGEAEALLERLGSLSEEEVAQLLRTAPLLRRLADSGR